MGRGTAGTVVGKDPGETEKNWIVEGCVCQAKELGLNPIKGKDGIRLLERTPW